MTYRTYLVTNIRLEKANEPYELALPTVFADYAILSEPYLRTHAVNFRDINFDAVEIDTTSRYWTLRTTEQSMIMDIIDDKYDKTVPVKVTPLVQSAMVIVLEQKEIDSDGLELAIFMKLQEYLPIHFLVEYI
jgi:hypothetical protein